MSTKEPEAECEFCGGPLVKRESAWHHLDVPETEDLEAETGENLDQDHDPEPNVREEDEDDAA